MSICIWCKRSNESSSAEHIIPEALGCPANFVLSDGVVCTDCNNRLGRVDRALIDDFDFLRHQLGIPRKRGRSPEIRSRGNVVATSNPKEISFNMDRASSIAHDGSHLSGYGTSQRKVKAELDIQGEIAKVSFSVEFGRNPDFIRGILKVAFESVAFFLGSELALTKEFDPIRNFVLRKSGQRKILLQRNVEGGFRNQVWAPYKLGENYASIFRLLCVEFAVDLSHDNSNFEILKRKSYEIYGKDGWTYLPIDE